MRTVNSKDDLLEAIKARETEVLFGSKNFAIIVAAATIAASLGITSTAGVILSATTMGVAIAPLSGGSSTVLIALIIASAAVIVTIIALEKKYKVKIKVNWIKGTLELRYY